MSPQVVLLVLRALAGLVLYGFLTTVLVLLWRELRLDRDVTHPPSDACLVAIGSKARVDYPLHAANLIGRAADCSILLSDESVSAHHARLSFAAGQWMLEDLGSKNGTFVNDLPLEQPLAVTYGDQLRFGSVQFIFERGAAAMTDGADPAIGNDGTMMLETKP